MITKHLEDLGGDRVTDGGNWISRRLLLARDGCGFSLHDTVLHTGTVTDMWYKNHLEAVYCVEGRGELLDKETGETHQVTPGFLYVLIGGERHRLTAVETLRMVCVFTPPVVGHEVHDEDGAYPLLDPDAQG